MRREHTAHRARTHRGKPTVAECHESRPPGGIGPKKREPPGRTGPKKREIETCAKARRPVRRYCSPTEGREVSRGEPPARMLVVVVIVLAAALVAAFAILGLRRSGSGAFGSKQTPEPGRSRADLRAGQGNAAARTRSESADADARFAGVELRVGSPACKAARRLAGDVFLMREAPALPLASCDVARCRCSFEKRPDRREDNRRWEDHGVQATITSAIERRGGRDRRRFRK